MKISVSAYSFGKYRETLGNEGMIRKAKEMGFDGIEFLDNYISDIDEAKRLLLETKRTVYDIAGDCGFTDMKFFYKVFKKHMGVLPSEYRKQAARGEE